MTGVIVTPCTAVIVTQLAEIAGAMVMLHWLVAVPEALLRLSITSAVKLNVPAIVGIPVIAPVAAFSVRPGGSEPAEI